MSNLTFGSVIIRQLRLWTPQSMSVRHWERKAEIRRFGYKDKILTRGALPRLKDAEPLSMPVYRPKNAWAEKRALFGQNDYIDILGDGNINPVQLLLNMPYWLRGLRGGEFIVQLRRRRELGEFIKTQQPKKYYEMNKRIRHLYHFINHKTKQN